MSKKSLDIEAKKDFSIEFQSDLIDIIKMCSDNGTDSCTIKFDYPLATLECDLTFRIIPKKKTILRGSDDEQK